jgi:2-polyprenyl-3-methyl-5-hydroxy-6-metoxy-1,4-benzoquinol methylase
LETQRQTTEIFPNKLHADRHQRTKYFADLMSNLADEIFKPQSVIDVGCGVGTLLKSFKDRGVAQIVGIEGPWLDKDLALIESSELIVQDLSTSLDVQCGPFDIACSFEVAEHLPESLADDFVELLCKLSDIVFFSAAIPKQGGYNHINEQWQSYWASKFHKHHYRPADIIRPRIWHEDDVSHWYKQNSLIYIGPSQIDNFASYLIPNSRPLKSLDIVHPETYLKHISM